ncbi:MAG: amino acid ABC transporter permease [Jiangellaceae bacterium]|nr:amino acid ABC transporter permease [Jiangellaceae bacterium]
MTSVLYDVAGPRTRQRILVWSLVGSAVIVALLVVAALRLADNGQFEADKYTPFFEEPALWRGIARALRATLQAAAYALVLATILGVLLAVGRMSHSQWLRLPSIGVIEFFRGVPLLLLIFFFFLGFPLAFGVNLPALWALVFGLTLYNGAVIAEIIRAGVHALPLGQTEAALAIGLTRGQTMRSVLLPQAFRIMLPALISQLVVLLKDTSLGFVIGYVELLRYGQRAAEQLDNRIQLTVVVAAIYIVINLSLSRLATWIESRQRRVAAPGTHVEEVTEAVGRQG